MAKNKEIDELRLFVATMLNSEQDKHSKLLADLHSAIGNTKEYIEASKVISQVYEAKITTLEKILDKIRGM